MNSDYTDISNRQIKFSNPSLSNKQSFQNLDYNLYQAQNSKENVLETAPISIRIDLLQKSLRSNDESQSEKFQSQNTSALNNFSN